MDLVWASVIVGLIGLWFGSDLTIDNAKKLAYRLGISEVVIGLTLIAVGTSLPEIVVNMWSGARRLAGLESSGIAVGNIIGASIANITLTLGVVSLFAILYRHKEIKLEFQEFGLFMALGAMVLVSIDGFISQLEAIVLVAIYSVYVYLLFSQSKNSSSAPRKYVRKKFKIDVLWEGFLVFIGLSAVILSADLVVRGGVSIAEKLGVSTILIGVFAGLGTGLPELSISLRAVARGAKHIAIGNLIGSNIANPLLALGLGAAFSGFLVQRTVLLFDIPFWLGATLVILYLLRKRVSLKKTESIVLIAIYAVYAIARIVIS